LHPARRTLLTAPLTTLVRAPLRGRLLRGRVVRTVLGLRRRSAPLEGASALPAAADLRTLLRARLAHRAASLGVSCHQRVPPTCHRAPSGESSMMIPAAWSCRAGRRPAP